MQPSGGKDSPSKQALTPPIADDHAPSVSFRRRPSKIVPPLRRASSKSGHVPLDDPITNSLFSRLYPQTGLMEAAPAATTPVASVFTGVVRDREDSKYAPVQAKKPKINPAQPLSLKNQILKPRPASGTRVNPLPVLPPIHQEQVDVEMQDVEEENGPMQFLEKVLKNPESKEFIYMIPVASKSGQRFNPYNLRIVEFSQVDTKSPLGYYTMSSHGVTHFDALGHGDFTPLDQWQRECHLFNSLLKISFFKQYRTWKCFRLWKSTILHTKIQNAKQKLSQHLFLLDPVLRHSLLDIQKSCATIVAEKKLIMIQPGTSYELGDFVRDQKSWIETINGSVLNEWEQFCTETVKKASMTCLNAKGFEIVLTNDILDDPVKQEQVKKLTFTEQAARRQECRRLQRFVKLTDYLIGTTLQQLVVQSVQELLKLSFKGCTDSDVVVDTTGTGMVILNENGLVETSPAERQDISSTEDLTNAKGLTAGIQVGGIVVGPEVGTERLANCGPDGFSDILCRLIMATVPKIELKEVIEDEGLPLEADVDMPQLTKPKPKEDQTKWKAGNADEKKFTPLFRTELLVKQDDSRDFYFAPSLNEYLVTIDALLKIYLNTAEKLPPLTNSIPFLDPANLAGGAYSAVRGLEDMEFGEGPHIATIIIESAYFKEVCGRIRGVLVGMFANATRWMKTLADLRSMWIENESFNALNALKESSGEIAHLLATNTEVFEGGIAQLLIRHQQKKEEEIAASGGELPPKKPSVLELAATVIQDEEGNNISPMVVFFEKALEQFAYQKQTMTAVPSRMAVNNILVDTTILKSILEPSPDRCFNDVAKLLPGLARDKNELLLTEAQTWVRILNTQPTSVEQFVEYLGWLEKVIVSMPTVEILEQEVTRLYGLLERFKIYIQPTDLAMYQTLSPTLRSLKDAIDIALDSKEENIAKFTADQDRSLNELMQEVSEIRNRAQDPMVLNPNSQSDHVLTFLDDLGNQLLKADTLKKKYEAWAELFRNGGFSAKTEETEEKEKPPQPEETGPNELEETKVELELKKTLWVSLKEWDNITSEWKSANFDALNTEDINTKITAYLKTVYTLDKGLPPNEVVPKLKNVVDEFRAMYPTIVDLRNPSLKARHWDKIQDAIGKSIPRDEGLTLGKLIENRVFDFKDEISTISGQAGSEASLEEMLSKVVKAWNEAEFIVTPYRDNKDVFILGTVEDIQTLLEDSQVTIATIRSSRFIGPIKSEVERWEKMLNLFSETLEQWMNCQRNWLYLESIFSAPDIQRQLPEEARMFSQVDRSWKDVMRKVSRNPNAIKAGTTPGLLETMQQNNVLLDQIQKCLEDYLESKRLLFPRFYFLSNDELLEILSQTKNPQAVQPHLSKCFDAIKSLEFSSGDPKSIDIAAMVSPEGEKVTFLKTIKARGNVEGWLGTVEEAMVAVLKRLIKTAIADFEDNKRADWVREHVGQVVVTGNQVLWTKDVTDALKSGDPNKSLLALKQKSISNLSGLAMLVRGELTKIQRAILGALITIDVHNRDIVAGLVQAKVTGAGDFEWTKQQRYYWDVESDTCHVKMSTSVFSYGYEYLGCSPRLVITPLTDRCYLTLTGAMQLNLGGSPVGPAGTGKTETVKDLAKAMARQCVVFNCSDGMDYKMMGKMFAGLAQSGAWCCFDEFNRIDIEVLSVIAQQLLTIKNAKDMKATKFIFEGREIRLIETCAAFITMNPGYAGRTELPDNLKALFRPISMMIPDYGLIAEIMLFSEGFENAKVLAGKVVNLYKLCSEQLSQQDHYDFGMRAVKSVLIMAGALKRSSPELGEDIVLIRSLRDSNLPKFLSEDIGLFRGILSDLFPGTNVPDRDFGQLVPAVKEALQARDLEPVDGFVARICQLYETTRIRHGVMLVGPTGGGKTTCYEVLIDACARLKEKNPHGDFQNIKTWVLNPKCVSMNELYGEFNLATMEWKDGLIGVCFRAQVSENTPDEKWTVCDGPVDALWIENMNTVLDDNKLLTLINGERIKMSPAMHMLFEVADLAVASPATVSRCGMVYMDAAILGWRAYVQQWLKKIPQHVHPEIKDHLGGLIESYIDQGLKYVRKNCKEYLKSVDLNLVTSLCRLLQTFINNTTEIDYKQQPGDMKNLFSHLFLFSYIWSIGGNLADGYQEGFDTFLREMLEQDPIEAIHLPANNLFGYFVSLKLKTFIPWDDTVPAFKYSSDIPYFEMMVPTSDTIKYAYLLEVLVCNNYPTLFTGNSGVGKSVIAQDLLNRVGKNKKFLNLNLNFSAQTNSLQTQQIMELKLEKKRKNISGAPTGFNKIVLFVDDLNMPKLDTYGSQPPIELLRQYLDFSGFYDREKLAWKVVEDISLVCACAPPGGGRNNVTPRFLRHFNMLNIPFPSEVSLAKIFRSITEGFLKPFSAEVKSASEAIVNSSIEIYHRMVTELLPTPAKSHYTFNLRDLSKVIQGMLQVRPQVISTKNDVARLFCHESARIFYDRLIDDTDRQYFNRLLSELVEKNFGCQITAEQLTQTPIMFCDFSKRGVPQEDRIYLEMSDMKVMNTLLEEYLEEYNVTMNQEARLIFFMDAKQHITRISRIIRQPRGNALLVGVGGTGKQSLTRLACHISDYRCIQVELTRTYGLEEWREDLKKLYRLAGLEGKNTVFLISDTQIKSEVFLEDINSILNSGEVPNLFEFDEREKILGDLRSVAREKGLSEDRDSVYQLFINRVRDNLHIVFGTSPVGDTFRNRCRMFPSLVNCCTIVWFDEWPREALLSVSRRFLEFVDLGSDELREKISEMCVEIHVSVGQLAKKFYQELRRRYYTTPTSYLELINSYVSMLSEKRKELGVARDRLKNGLSKLQETNELVANMQIELQMLGPELKQKAQDTEELMIKIAKDQETADGVRKVVAEEEAMVRETALQTEAIASDAQKDLDEALPALESAFKALDALDKKDISELKVFAKPPEAVAMVLEAICILFKVKPDWDSSKKLLGDPQFMKKLQEYDKDNIPEAITKKLRKYIETPGFTPEAIEKVSKACKSLVMWVIAMELYSRVFKQVAPKRKRLEEAQASLQETQAKLAEKAAALQEVEAQLDKLKATYENSVASKKLLVEKMDETQRRLARASKLTTALADEQIRWTESVQKLNSQIESLIGNIFLSSACVAYFGAFTSAYRHELVQGWIQKCKEMEIPVSETFTLVESLAEPATVRDWNIQGLPADNLSTENGILVTRGRRWPLMIDPQGQANRWIRNMEGNNLKVIKLSEPKFLRSLENAVRTGQSVLMEDVGETLDPALEPLLLKQTIRQSGRLMMKLGDSLVEYDRNFKLFITTKLQNPHYLPEVCIKVTIINFTVTKQGLEGQLLADVVKLEKPELEQQRNSLIVNIANDKKQLKDIEDKILKLLFNSQGNILDDEELIDTLNQSKVTSAAINVRLKEAEETEIQINNAREKYRPVALRGSVLYFVIADLAEIDPMYQFSLKYFKNLFNNTIQESPKSDNLDERIAVLCKNTTFDTFANVSRGLFEAHKLIFSFMICIETMRERNKIETLTWNFFLRGSGTIRNNLPEKPNARWLSANMWTSICDLALTIPQFGYIIDHISTYPGHWESLINADSPLGTPVPGDTTGSLTLFERLLLIKVLREEKLVASTIEFITLELGSEFVVLPPLDLGKAFKDTSATSPLIFILSTGSDPVSSLMKFAGSAKIGMQDKLQMISLGQGQGPIAEEMIKKAVTSGDWVFLQNCHLAASWMPKLESIIKEFANTEADINPTFRLILSSMPSRVFPTSVLQDGVKVTNEPPKGLRANLARSFADVSRDLFDDHPPQGVKFKKLLFGICFFNAIIHERKKFGPLGWNISYDFSNSDLEVSITILKNMLVEYKNIPWDALTYLTGEITFGGRVTDEWDRRTLRSILARFYTPQILDDAYQFSASGLYHAPTDGDLNSFRGYIDSLPLNEEPSVFGMHENANISYQLQETRRLVRTVLDVQPRLSSGGAGRTNEEIVTDLAQSILEKWPPLLHIEVPSDRPKSASEKDRNPVLENLFKRDDSGRMLNSLSVVLLQEVARFNRLNTVVKTSLENITKAVKGFIVMSSELELVFKSLLNNEVPSAWAHYAYPSLKTLGSWVKDFLLRIEMVTKWANEGQPASFWLPGFFFPQGFLTGVLQNHARRSNIPIDTLMFHYKVRDIHADDPRVLSQEYQDEGVLVSGLFMEGARWDMDRKLVQDSFPMEMFSTMPLIQFIPTQTISNKDKYYACPLYKTAARAGTLSTTGHSTNFVVTILLPSDRPADYWIAKGVALLCQLTE
ncbi:dynein heavy chain and region D6 of dynein motor-domain-containing protein [Gorgonomyces haynaldii]|nr:dynein heavy chain and region D6 of dynein motor-domain-containing protein [Gorgonomyces haynaldii]